MGCSILGFTSVFHYYKHKYLSQWALESRDTVWKQRSGFRVLIPPNRRLHGNSERADIVANTGNCLPYPNFILYLSRRDEHSNMIYTLSYFCTEPYTLSFYLTSAELPKLNKQQNYTTTRSVSTNAFERRFDRFSSFSSRTPPQQKNRNSTTRKQGWDQLIELLSHGYVAALAAQLGELLGAYLPSRETADALYVIACRRARLAVCRPAAPLFCLSAGGCLAPIPTTQELTNESVSSEGEIQEYKG
ncbi:hypothetical protein BHE74_00006364 [Ensete ventricosum]|nr:hypothetical protein BHE74_00006364 [Ensete ventricosum]